MMYPIQSSSLIRNGLVRDDLGKVIEGLFRKFVK